MADGKIYAAYSGSKGYEYVELIDAVKVVVLDSNSHPVGFSPPRDGRGGVEIMGMHSLHVSPWSSNVLTVGHDNDHGLPHELNVVAKQNHRDLQRTRRLLEVALAATGRKRTAAIEDALRFLGPLTEES